MPGPVVADTGSSTDGAPAPTPDGDERPLPAAVVVAVALLLTALLSVWAAFLVPFRVGSVVVPLWLLPLVAMVAVARLASRRVGLWGALGPALLWLALSWLVLGTTRSEGDLVVPATATGYVYLCGGFVPWLVVVALASSSPRGEAPAPSSRATPAGSPRR